MPTLPRRQWDEMSWEEIHGADTSGWIAVLPVAAIEQHGPHLPLGVDRYIIRGYIDAALPLMAADLPVSFLPLQAVGKSDEHLHFPGTLTLAPETAIAAWTEIGESVARAGVRKLVLLNSHGGNVSVIDIVARNLRVRAGMLVVTASLHRFGYPEGLFTTAETAHGIHGGDIETSLMLAFRPDLVRAERTADFTPASLAMAERYRWLSADRPFGFGWMSQDLHPSGAIGDASLASREKGEAAAAHGARALVELLHDVRRFPLDALPKGPLG
ncbi:MAG TPA: creatininase family protein [Hyphomicrobiales bacterium]|nr:creatininase family protein [Hyphomicrobiales bacterium]